MSDEKQYYYYKWIIPIGGYGYTPEEAWIDATDNFVIEHEDMPPEYFGREEVEE